MLGSGLYMMDGLVFCCAIYAVSTPADQIGNVYFYILTTLCVVI
ncbi:MAG: hypothetical protein RIR11_1078, partial [Bacteroidota bacterium]